MFLSKEYSNNRLEFQVFFSEARKSYECTLSDLSLECKIFANAQKDPLFVVPPFVVCLFDAKHVWVLATDDRVQFRQDLEYREENGVRYLAVQHDVVSKNIWDRRVMSEERGMPGGTAWEKIGERGELLWDVLAEPQLVVISDPNKPEKLRNHGVIIPHIVVPPAGILARVPNTPLIELYKEKWHNHEVTHVGEMRGKVWASPDDTEALQEHERVSCSVQTLKEGCEWLGGGELPEVVSRAFTVIEGHDLEHYFLRGYLGETFGFLGEMYQVVRDIYSQKNGDHSYDFQAYLQATKEGAATLPNKFHGVPHKNVVGFELAWWLCSQIAQGNSLAAREKGKNLSRDDVLRIAMVLRTLMLGRIPLNDMFFEEDVLRVMADELSWARKVGLF